MTTTTNDLPKRKQRQSFWSDSGSPQATNDFGHVRLSFDRSWRSSVYYAALSLSLLLLLALDWAAMSKPSLASLAMGVAVPLALAATGWFSAPRRTAASDSKISWAARALGVLPGAFVAVLAIAAMAKG
jgi:hypothetical protein